MDKQIKNDAAVLHPDAKLIDDLGGPVKLAERLGYKVRGGAERVNNWRWRGIPAKIKLDNLQLFRVREQRRKTSSQISPPMRSPRERV